MAFKHQAKSFRQAGLWTCWCDAGSVDQAQRIVSRIRADGFKCRRSSLRVFVLAVDAESGKLPTGSPEELAA